MAEAEQPLRDCPEPCGSTPKGPSCRSSLPRVGRTVQRCQRGTRRPRRQAGARWPHITEETKRSTPENGRKGESVPVEVKRM